MVNATLTAPSAYPPDKVHIVTWYMADALSFPTLVQLLTQHPQYQQVKCLEMVTPSSEVEEELVEQLARFLSRSRYLKEVTLYTVKIEGYRSSLMDTTERHY